MATFVRGTRTEWVEQKGDLVSMFERSRAVFVLDEDDLSVGSLH